MKDFAVSKSTQTVKGTILQTLGLIAEVFPDTVSPKTQQLFTMFIVRFRFYGEISTIFAVGFGFFSIKLH
jgi:hypothetical protein